MRSESEGGWDGTGFRVICHVNRDLSIANGEKGIVCKTIRRAGDAINVTNVTDDDE